jgi:hypothetical protein
MPNVTVVKVGGGDLALYQALSKLAKTDVLVGIPAATAGDRANFAKQANLLKGTTSKGKRKKARLANLAIGTGVNNAELLFIHTNGSPIRGIPPRPVIEPAIMANGNRQEITGELESAADAMIAQEPVRVLQFLRRAGMAAATACKKWFVDPRNNWAPNAPATIRAKGSDRPLIDTGEMRKSITYVVRQHA